MWGSRVAPHLRRNPGAHGPGAQGGATDVKEAGKNLRSKKLAWKKTVAARQLLATVSAKGRQGGIEESPNGMNARDLA